MPVGDADVALRVAAQVFSLEKGREARAGDVHLTSNPERLLGVEGQRDHLVNVVRGRVVASEVVHVAGVADEQDVDTDCVHAALHIGDPLQVFRSLEGQHRILLERAVAHLRRWTRPLSQDHPAMMKIASIAAVAMPLIQSPSRSESGSYRISTVCSPLGIGTPRSA